MVKIGVLALQGAVSPHLEKLHSIQCIGREVRLENDLKGLSGLILPGGESTTMIHLLKLNQLWEGLKTFSKERPVWGVCAGAILLAKEVQSPSQESLKLLDITIERNGFGRQNESFVDTVEPTKHWIDSERLEGIFIRAPRIRRLSENIQTYLTWRDEPVCVGEGRILISTFHPELTTSSKIHQYFKSLCQNQ